MNCFSSLIFLEYLSNGTNLKWSQFSWYNYHERTFLGNQLLCLCYLVFEKINIFTSNVLVLSFIVFALAVLKTVC